VCAWGRDGQVIVKRVGRGDGRVREVERERGVEGKEGDKL